MACDLWTILRDRLVLLLDSSSGFKRLYLVKQVAKMLKLIKRENCFAGICKILFGWLRFGEEIFSISWCQPKYSVTSWSTGLIPDHEVAGSIPGTSTLLNVEYVWCGAHPASWGQLGSCLIENYRIWLRKSTLLDLMEHNANHIIP